MASTVEYPVDSFPASSATTDEVVKSLIKSGGCFIRGLVNQEDILAMMKQVQPYLDADVPWEGDFFPKETRRTFTRLKVHLGNCLNIDRSQWFASKITNLHFESLSKPHFR